jgi:fibronectin type 3 domain-containing protein
VALTWADAGTDVSVYNIYRSTAITSQGTQINSTLDPSPDYTDSTVLAGQTYYYVTTAVSTSGVESTPSNQVKAKIPTP